MLIKVVVMVRSVMLVVLQVMIMVSDNDGCGNGNKLDGGSDGDCGNGDTTIDTSGGGGDI